MKLCMALEETTLTTQRCAWTPPIELPLSQVTRKTSATPGDMLRTVLAVTWMWNMGLHWMYLTRMATVRRNLVLRTKGHGTMMTRSMEHSESAATGEPKLSALYLQQGKT